DITTDVATNYARILAEYRANRFTPDLTTKLQTNIVGPLDTALRQEFPNFEEAHNVLSARLNAEVVPEPDVLNNARQRMNELRERMRQIRDAIGQILDVQKLITQAKAIEDGLTRNIGPGLKRLVEQKE